MQSDTIGYIFYVSSPGKLATKRVQISVHVIVGDWGWISTCYLKESALTFIVRS